MEFSSVFRPRGDEYELLEGCYVHRVTDRAMLITFDDEMHWVPKSVIREPDGLEQWAEDVDIEVAGWFARKEGLI